MLQSRTKLLENVSPLMYPILRVKTISKTTAPRKRISLPQVNVASSKRPRIRLSLEDTRTLLPGGGGKGRIGTATMFRKMLTKCAILSRVLSKIVDSILAPKDVSESARMNTQSKLMFSQKPLDNTT